jgi:hypothetical protein
VFAAIVTNFLLALAAFELEKGASVLVIDSLLNSRSVFNAVTMPFSRKTYNITCLLLIFLWLLSPFGGQASLRVVSTGPHNLIYSYNFTYLAFMSDDDGDPLEPINTIFENALSSPSEDMNSPQDIYGNVKIPVYEYLDRASSEATSPWRQVPNNINTSVPWSSLAGLPIHNLPSNGLSKFVLNTGYMLTECNVSSQGINQTGPMIFNDLENSTMYWSHANYGINQPDYGQFTFISLGQAGSPDQALTTAECTMNMSYVMVRVKCTGRICSSVEVMPSTQPASHPSVNDVWPKPLNSTPVDGHSQDDDEFPNFFKKFVGSINPQGSCETSFCDGSIIEAYLENPAKPFHMSDDILLWKVGNELMSQRLGQLINTYWIDSIAPFAVSGNLTLPLSPQDPTYNVNTDTSIGTIEVQNSVVLVCNIAWCAVLLIVSMILLVISIATALLNLCRRGPTILDSFSSLIRDNRYCDLEIPHLSSMEDAFHQSKRLQNVIVRLGDVKPEDDIGHIAVGVVTDEKAVRRIHLKRLYD